MIFASLNTLHHFFMYAYFGGAQVFSDVLPWTGSIQLGVGILVELYQLMMNWTTPGPAELRGGKNAVWANVLALVLLSIYAVLWSGDLKERSRERVEEKTGKFE